MALFHRFITESKFEIPENLRFNEFETVKIIKPRLYLDFDTLETKKLSNNFQGCTQDFLSYMYLPTTVPQQYF